MYLILFIFIQTIQSTEGIVFYKNSRVFFKTLTEQTYEVQSWEILQTPTDQVIEVSYRLADNKVTNLKMTKEFTVRYKKSNRLMKEAEKLMKQRQFVAALDSFNIVEKLNPFLPYLYSNLLYVQSQLKNDSNVQTVIEIFESRRKFISDLEQSVFYYSLYDYWRNTFDKTQKLHDLKKAVDAVSQSYSLRPDDDKLRILQSVTEKYKVLSE